MSKILRSRNPQYKNLEKSWNNNTNIDLESKRLSQMAVDIKSFIVQSMRDPMEVQDIVRKSKKDREMNLNTYAQITTLFNFQHHEGTDFALELRIIKTILLRENILMSLQTLSERSLKSLQLDGSALLDLLSQMRNLTLQYLLTLIKWRETSEDGNIFRPFYWRIEKTSKYPVNYTMKVITDLNFLALNPIILQALQLSSEQLSNNPLMLKNNLHDFTDFKPPEESAIEDNGGINEGPEYDFRLSLRLAENVLREYMEYDETEKNSQVFLTEQQPGYAMNAPANDSNQYMYYNNNNSSMMGQEYSQQYPEQNYVVVGSNALENESEEGNGNYYQQPPQQQPPQGYQQLSYQGLYQNAQYPPQYPPNYPPNNYQPNNYPPQYPPQQQQPRQYDDYGYQDYDNEEYYEINRRVKTTESALSTRTAGRDYPISRASSLSEAPYSTPYSAPASAPGNYMMNYDYQQYEFGHDSFTGYGDDYPDNHPASNGKPIATHGGRNREEDNDEGELLFVNEGNQIPVSTYDSLETQGEQSNANNNFIPYYGNNNNNNGENYADMDDISIAKSVRSIDSVSDIDLRVLLNLKIPPKVAVLAGSACIVLFTKEGEIPTDISWKAFCKLNTKIHLNEQMNLLHPDRIPKENILSVQTILEQLADENLLNVSLPMQEHIALVKLVTWVKQFSQSALKRLKRTLPGMVSPLKPTINFSNPKGLLPIENMKKPNNNNNNNQPVMEIEKASKAKKIIPKVTLELCCYYSELLNTKQFKNPILIMVLTTADYLTYYNEHISKSSSHTYNKSELSLSTVLPRVVIKAIDTIDVCEVLVHINMREYSLLIEELAVKIGNDAKNHFTPGDLQWWADNLRRIIRVQTPSPGKITLSIIKKEVEAAILRSSTLAMTAEHNKTKSPVNKSPKETTKKEVNQGTKAQKVRSSPPSSSSGKSIFVDKKALPVKTNNKQLASDSKSRSSTPKPKEDKQPSSSRSKSPTNKTNSSQPIKPISTAKKPSSSDANKAKTPKSTSSASATPKNATKAMNNNNNNQEVVEQVKEIIETKEDIEPQEELANIPIQSYEIIEENIPIKEDNNDNNNNNLYEKDFEEDFEQEEEPYEKDFEEEINIVKPTEKVVEVEAEHDPYEEDFESVPTSQQPLSEKISSVKINQEIAREEEEEDYQVEETVEAVEAVKPMAEEAVDVEETPYDADFESSDHKPSIDNNTMTTASIMSTDTPFKHFDGSSEVVHTEDSKQTYDSDQENIMKYLEDEPNNNHEHTNEVNNSLCYTPEESSLELQHIDQFIASSRDSINLIQKKLSKDFSSHSQENTEEDTAALKHAKELLLDDNENEEELVENTTTSLLQAEPEPEVVTPVLPEPPRSANQAEDEAANELIHHISSKESNKLSAIQQHQQELDELKPGEEEEDLYNMSDDEI